MKRSGHRTKGERTARGHGHSFGARYPEGRSPWLSTPNAQRRTRGAEQARCPHCGVPDVPETKDDAGRCRYCQDGEDTPF
jgi:hypothetical protein